MARKDKIELTLDDAVPFLEQLTGEGEGRLIELKGKRVSFGRGQENDIVILSESVSRNHAAIFKKGPNWFVEDAGSKNGVFVNGSFHKKAPLTAGDVIQIGEIAFRFNHPQVEASQVSLEPSLRKQRAQSAAYVHQNPVSLNEFMDSVENRMHDLRGGGATSRLPFYLLTVLGLTGLIYLSFPKGTTIRKVSNDEAMQASMAEVTTDTSTSKMPAAAEPFVAPVEPNLPSALKLPAKLTQPLVSPRSVVLEDHEEVSAYLDEGRRYLRMREFESAAKAFQFALIIDPENQTALMGIHAAEYRMTDLTNVPLDQLPALKGKKAKRGGSERENEKAAMLIEKARRELTTRNYTAAIKAATSAQKLKLSKDSPLAEEASGIAAKARQARKEEFDLFLNQAKEKLDLGEYRAARNLCDEILRRDPDYDEAKDCLRRAVRGK